MNQTDIKRRTTQIQPGQLVEVLFQNPRFFGLVIKVHARRHDRRTPQKDPTFLTLFTKKGLRKYPISWCALIENP